MKLGKSFDQVKSLIQIKTIEIDLGEIKFNLRIRVPLKAEMEDMNARIINPPSEKIEAIYKKMVEPLLNIISEGGDEFAEQIKDKNKIVVTDKDLIIDGTSLRQVSALSASEETKTEEYFHLLLSETDEPISESYEQIIVELPDFAIKEIVAAIQRTIAPDYKDIKKN